MNNRQEEMENLAVDKIQAAFDILNLDLNLPIHEAGEFIRAETYRIEREQPD